MAKNCYSERLLSIIDALGMTDAEIVKEIDSLDKTLMSHIRNGRQGASLNLISSFCERFPLIDANYILTGNGPMFKTQEGEMENTDILTPEDRKVIQEAYQDIVEERDRRIAILEKEIIELKIKYRRTEIK